MDAIVEQRYRQVAAEIADLSWSTLSRSDLVAVAWSYYFFSIQFRESLVLACDLHPWDDRLQSLREGECDTNNLSPFPGIADEGERMNHDEFMRRILVISELPAPERRRIEQIGARYLAATRSLPAIARALSIPSYEDGGLETVFRAMLTSPDWAHPSLLAFQHFLVEHIRFDSDDQAGHGALSRHLLPDDRIMPLWVAFRDLLTSAVPALVSLRRQVYA